MFINYFSLTSEVDLKRGESPIPYRDKDGDTRGIGYD